MLGKEQQIGWSNVMNSVYLLFPWAGKVVDKFKILGVLFGIIFRGCYSKNECWDVGQRVIWSNTKLAPSYLPISLTNKLQTSLTLEKNHLAVV